jgi:hypothetical protein
MSPANIDIYYLMLIIETMFLFNKGLQLKQQALPQWEELSPNHQGTLYLNHTTLLYHEILVLVTW